MRLRNETIFEQLKETRISVVVPVFNEAPRIQDNLAMLISQLEPNFKSYEIIVVSDGSTDGTSRILRDFQHPHVRSIVFDTNMGKGAAVRAGFEQASGEYLFFIDGGMELHPRELRILLGLMALYDVDMVVGSKRHPQSRVYYPWYRKGLSFAYQQLVRALFHVNVTDTQVGLKLLKRDVVDAILPDLRIDRYGFDLEIFALARRKGFTRILEAPITLDYWSRAPREPVKDLLHVLRIGTSILGDTWRLHERLRRDRR